MPDSRQLLAALFLPLALVLGAMGTASEPSPEPSEAATPDAGSPDAGPVEPPAAPETAVPQLGLVPPQPVPSRKDAPPITHLRTLTRKEDLLSRAKLRRDGKLVVPEPGGEAALTIDVTLQDQLTRIMQDYQVPYGAAVVIEPSTGRVLALAEHSQAQPDMRGLTTRAVFPAASIFKIVTSSALLEAGVSPDEEACFHGGKRRLDERLLADSERDGACYSLAAAMGKSANVIFAKMTKKYLAAGVLRSMAARLRFNRPISFPIPTDVSLASIPEDEFGLANAGAGFGDVFLSPLHGAALAAASATGVWRDPVLFEPVAGQPVAGEQVLSPQVQRALADMMEQTVTNGTARRIFRERAFRVQDAVGKTGTLADRSPFHDYSWFVGFAPKDHPRVAVAALVVNDPLWRIRGTWLGREAMRLALERLPVPARAVVKEPLVAEKPVESSVQPVVAGPANALSVEPAVAGTPVRSAPSPVVVEPASTGPDEGQEEEKELSEQGEAEMVAPAGSAVPLAK